jgi:hypothetical protein
MTIDLARASRLAVVLLAVSACAVAAACGSEPAVSDNASFQRWRSWCSCKGGTAPSTFNEAQRTGCRASSSSVLPGPQGGGQAIGQALGLLVLEAFKEGPAAEARRQEVARRAEQERIAQEQAQKARANRLLDEMLEVGGAARPGTDAEAEPKGRGLMLGDEVPRRTDASVGTDPYAPTIGGLPLMTDADGSASVMPGGTEPGTAQDKVERSDAFNLGFDDARGCYSESAGARCSAVAQPLWQACLDDYRSGFSAGKRTKQVKLDEAWRIGRADGAAGRPANAIGRPEAEGTCKVEWTQSYNRGWFDGKPRP